MSFTEAVSSVYRNYAKFDGRATRSEYWWFVLFTILVSLGIYLLAFLLYAVSRTSAIFGLVIVAVLVFILISLIPSIAVGVRRLHDTDRSGWWYLISFIPYLGGIILLILLALPGTPGYNRFGPPPGRSSSAQRAQYWGPGRPEALRKFAEDAQRAAASGYHPVWQEWKMGPTGELLEVVYDIAPQSQGWMQPGYGWSQPGYGGTQPGYGQPPAPYAGAPYQTGPTAYPPGGSWYQGGPGQPATAVGTAPSGQPGDGAAGDAQSEPEKRSGQPGAPPEPPSWT